MTVFVEDAEQGTLDEIIGGMLLFDVDGHLYAESQSSNFHPNGVQQPIKIWLGDPTVSGGSGVNGITQMLDGGCGISFAKGDGHPAE